MSSDAQLRDEVRAWLAAHWDPAADRAAWTAAVVDAGYAVPRWPRAAFGRELDEAQARIVEAEFARAGAPGSGQDRTNLWAGTLLTFGTDELRARLLRPLLENRVRMCLLYSEPGAGSDLAGVRTSAVRDGEEYVVDGQKVWTSNAAGADYGMLLARTDPAVPKHRGLSFFFLPMDQPGVEVRPLRQITGEAHFNEVFLTGARVPAANLLGGPGQGWRVLLTALAFERVALGSTNLGAMTRANGRAEADLPELAKRHGRAGDVLLRRDIARVFALRSVNRWTNQRALAQAEQGGSSPLASLGKLAMSRIVHETGRVQSAIVGAQALLEGPEHPDGDDANFASMNAYFTSIGGGTDQIQRNIIGERLLGLPREPEVDRDVPFQDVPRSS
ncbi:acyl-CoA dehydrogenase family protein [Blastococcus sp. TML/M2B]|uniref:acyl-CoA dehydrogenase family protein n=1 Tax=unclassified Blastococcus TaxID=2619396 RepID=UPI00190D24DE|nr:MULTISPECIES: acyl-CoA dehydrogenase family protein [unclassified Blastococcus]MBN1091371.1 acyl-CoA dehydrogenase family protein [Blastococcus sp. TML/M2B]MBN1095073.1 acyl-CoA dehydrogenase family protein [Blastococcus sp. TML/C7B]